MIKQAVIAGMRLALISRHTVRLELSLGLLTTLPVDGVPLMRGPSCSAARCRCCRVIDEIAQRDWQIADARAPTQPRLARER